MAGGLGWECILLVPKAGEAVGEGMARMLGFLTALWSESECTHSSQEVSQPLTEKSMTGKGEALGNNQQLRGLYELWGLMTSLGLSLPIFGI
jgi:hypothetical protein